MRSFSIRTLMGLVLALAVAFAALRGANEHWAGGLLLATLALLGYSILAVAYRQGPGRAAWLGFLVIGGGYLLAVRALPPQESGWLPTSQLLSYAERQVVGPNTLTVNFTPSGTITTTATTAVIQGPTPPAPTAATNVSGNFVVFTSPATANGSVRLWNPATPAGTTWATLLPGAANGDAFKSVGQSLSALLFGGIGAIGSKRMFARRSPPLEIGHSPVATGGPNML